MNKIKIGVVLKSLGLPLRRALAAAQKMGASGVELDAAGDLAPQRLSQTGRREILHLLRSYDIELSALNCPLRFGLDVAENQEARIDHVSQVMSLAFELGPRLVIVHAGRITEDEQDPGTRRLTDSLTALGQHGDRIGAVLALETGVDSPEMQGRFLGRFDSGSLAINFSPAPLMMNGHDPQAAVRTFGKRIVHGHASDARATLAGRAAQEVPLGHGDIDWLGLLGVLEEIGYHSWLDVERRGGVDALKDVGAGVNFLQQLIR